MSDYEKAIHMEEGAGAAREFSKDYGLKLNNKASGSLRYRMREYVAELMGTLILCLCGSGVTAQVLFNKAAVGSSYLSINLGWALGLSMGILVAGPVSGGHLNPAVTVTNALFGKFSWRKVPGYVFCQTLGAFLGAALVYLIYWPAFYEFDKGTRYVTGKFSTAGIFATYPHPATPIYNAFFTEIIDTAFLLIGVLAITNPKYKVPTWGVALAAGGLLAVIGMSVGLMTGYAMNPARDFGPRIFTAIAGWGGETFSAHGYYFWVPLFAPFLGAPLGMAIYDYLIDVE